MDNHPTTVPPPDDGDRPNSPSNDHKKFLSTHPDHTTPPAETSQPLHYPCATFDVALASPLVTNSLLRDQSRDPFPDSFITSPSAPVQARTLEHREAGDSNLGHKHENTLARLDDYTRLVTALATNNADAKHLQPHFPSSPSVGRLSSLAVSPSSTCPSIIEVGANIKNCSPIPNPLPGVPIAGHSLIVDGIALSEHARHITDTGEIRGLCREYTDVDKNSPMKEQ
ncbi:hypothetical protein Hypma_003606 [Hypsizygus marmoreus]|uniref:Uncharacterized protein n=1 Tax=Hypsizygus marmoreus TaxID=39966 RepID=A0A369J898_HYPMA|nr:hypothetical protein Hypma_003606 [Hypsizygus marmoreus]